MIRGEEFEALPKYSQAHEYKCDALAAPGFDLGNERLRDLHLNELQSRGQSNSDAHKAMIGWNNADPNNPVDSVDIDAGKKALNEVFKARLCIKRAGKDHEQCRR